MNFGLRYFLLHLVPESDSLKKVQCLHLLHLLNLKLPQVESFLQNTRDQEKLKLARLYNMILPKIRDPRFITIRRGGTLIDENHRLLALWAATCAEHVLPL